MTGNKEAIKSVLGAMLLEDTDAIDTALAMIDDSFMPAHDKPVFIAIKAVYARGDIPDNITVAAELRKMGKYEQVGGSVYLAELMGVAVTPANISYHLKLVYGSGMLKKLGHQCDLTKSRANQGDDYQEVIEDHNNRLDELEKTHSVIEVRTPDFDLMDDFREISKSGGIVGLPSGFKDLDILTGGFEKSNIYLVGGHSKHGKTCLVLDIFRHFVLNCGCKVGFFSIEMGRIKIKQRLICQDALVNSRLMRMGKLKNDDWARMDHTLDKFRSVKDNICFDYSADVTALDVRKIAKKMKKKMGGLDAIIIDSTEQMKNHIVDRDDLKVNEKLKELKAACKALDIPIICVHGLSPEQSHGGQKKRPNATMFKGSKNLEYIIDMALLIWRPEQVAIDAGEEPSELDKGTGKIIVGKSRNDVQGTVSLAFLSQYTSWRNLAKQNDDSIPFQRHKPVSKFTKVNGNGSNHANQYNL